MNEQDKHRSKDRHQRLKVIVFSGLAGYRCHSMDVVSTNLLRGLRQRRIAVLDVPLRAPKWFEWVRPRLLAEFLLRYIAYPFVAFRCWSKFRGRPAYFIDDHANAFIARAIPRQAKVIVLVQDLASMMPLRAIPFRKTWQTYLIHFLGVCFKRGGVYRADHIVTGAATIREEVVRWLKKRPDEVSVIYDGFDEQTFTSGDKAEARETLGLNQAAIYVLSVASSQPRKNISCLIRALRELRGRIKNAKLLYVGDFDGPAKKLIQDYDLNDAIIRFRNISDAQLAQLYRAADVYAFPSQYEGFGLPAVEAMACSCPVVTSEAPTLLEIVGGCGLAAATNDSAALAKAMERIIREETLAKQLIAAGRERVRMFYWSKSAARLETVFAMALGSIENGDVEQMEVGADQSSFVPAVDSSIHAHFERTTA
ncbi:MAG: glycosyltransferase family 1 protein [Candidatus Paceibacterota bacterium]